MTRKTRLRRLRRWRSFMQQVRAETNTGRLKRIIGDHSSVARYTFTQGGFSPSAELTLHDGFEIYGSGHVLFSICLRDAAIQMYRREAFQLLSKPIKK